MVAWPCRQELWRGHLDAGREAVAELVRAIARFEPVTLLARPSDACVAAEMTSVPGVEVTELPLDDSWVRDTGPIYVVGRGRRVALDFRFNGWGGRYCPHDQDQAIPRRWCERRGEERVAVDLVLEGGSIAVDGAGTLVTTEQCLLNPNRNPHLSRAEIETYLGDYLGVSKVVWLGEGIVGDDTDGHVDDIARFVNERTIVCAVEEDPSDPNHELLDDNLRRLELATDARGRNFEIVTLPMPGEVAGRDGRLPASYANFLIANAVVLLPTFNHPNDARAAETLQRLFPTRRVTPVPASDLVWGMGTIHCLSQQQPAA